MITYLIKKWITLTKRLTATRSKQIELEKHTCCYDNCYREVFKKLSTHYLVPKLERDPES
jgi:hypothetical protein